MKEFYIHINHSKFRLCFILCLICIVQNGWTQIDVFDVFRKGSVNELKLLFEENPEIINSPNEVGYTPLVLACYSGNKEVVAFLVDKVDNIDGLSNYGTPLMAAVFKGYSEIVRILIENGVDVNMTDAKGTTAAHYAVMFRNYNLIEQLVNANADFELKNNLQKSALDYAEMYNDNKINEILTNK